MQNFSFTIKSKDLSKGLRPSKRMPRNSKFLVECVGAVGRDGVLSALDELTNLIENTYTYAYDNETGSFSVGDTIYGADGAEATVIRAGTNELDLLFTSGSLSDDEIIYTASYGSELVADGSFDGDGSAWYWGTGWSLDSVNHKADCDGSQTAWTSLADNNTGIQMDTFYICEFTVSNYFSGNVRINLTGENYSDWRSEDGSYVEIIFVNTGSGTQTIVQAGANFIGSVDNVSVKQITNAALVNGSASNTFTFPYPQIFVFTNVIIICSDEHIYEWSGGELVHKLTVSAGSTWCALDFYDYVYLSNGNVAVVRDAMDKTYSETTDLPTAMAACNFNGQVLLGAPDAGYES